MPQLVEEDLLQLLGRAEVELAADRPRSACARRPRHRRREVRLAGLRAARVSTAMPVRSMPASTCDERQLDLGEQRGAAALVELGVEADGEVEHGAGPHHRRGAPASASSVSSDSCPESSASAAQLAVQVAQRQVDEVEGALSGQHEVGGERGVAGEPAERQPRARRASSGPFASCTPSARSGSASQAASAVVVGRRRASSGSSHAAAPSAAASASARRRRRCRGPTCPRRERRRVAVRRVRGQPGRHGRAGRAARRRTSNPPSAAGSAAARRASANSRSRSTRNCRASNTWCTSSRSQRATGQVVGRRPAASTSRDQLGERAVAQHVGRGSRAARRRPCP